MSILYCISNIYSFHILAYKICIFHMSFNFNLLYSDFFIIHITIFLSFIHLLHVFSNIILFIYTYLLFSIRFIYTYFTIHSYVFYYSFIRILLFTYTYFTIHLYIFHYSLIRILLFTINYSLFTIYHLPFTIYYPIFTIYY